jgi:hypothetical protein
LIIAKAAGCMPFWDKDSIFSRLINTALKGATEQGEGKIVL